MQKALAEGGGSGIFAFTGGYWWLLVALLLVVAVFALRPLFKRSSDIKSPELDPELDWTGDAAEGSLQAIYGYVLAVNADAVAWYQQRRTPKRRWGLAIRLSALLLTAAAGFIPLTDELFSAPLSPVWSTVLLGLAGVMVSIDVLVGSTSGWIRYMLAQQQIERLKTKFMMDWNALKAGGTDTADRLALAKKFLLAMDKVIADETQEWAAEFRKALQDMEKARREAEEIRRSGAVEVSIKNGDVVEWALEIDGGERGQTTGKTIAVTDVSVGVHKLKAQGKDKSGKVLVDESKVLVEAGTVATKELELT